MVKDLISLIFPQNCVNCNTSLISEEQYLCTACKIDLPFTDDHALPENELFRKFAFQPKIKSARAFIYFHQGGMTQKLLHQLKYQGKKDIGFQMGRWFSARLEDLEFDHIIPVPLHRRKQRSRGYNQSECIANGICDELSIEVRTDLIRRQKSSQSQTRKTRLRRWMDLENVYSEASGEVEGKRVLVVDDVVTTGATIGMLCERLAQKHVDAIHIATIARGK